MARTYRNPREHVDDMLGLIGQLVERQIVAHYLPSLRSGVAVRPMGRGEGARRSGRGRLRRISDREDHGEEPRDPRNSWVSASPAFEVRTEQTSRQVPRQELDRHAGYGQVRPVTSAGVR